MQFRELLKNSIDDLREFFDDKLEFKVEILERASRMHICVKGAGEEKKIAISKDMANYEIDNSIDYLMCLIIIGHEMAHCLCEHNKFINTERMDGVAIEGYADYFGARITYSLLNFGKFNFKEFSKIYEAIPFSSRARLNKWLARDEIFRVTGLSLKKLNDLFYKSADGTGKYPCSETRVLTFIAGIVSFFYRYQGNISQRNFLKIFCTIWDSGEFVSSIDHSSQEHIERIGRIHSDIQGDNKRITSGISDKYDRLFSTEFDISEKSIKRRINGFKHMFSSWDDELSENIINQLNQQLDNIES